MAAGFDIISATLSLYHVYNDGNGATVALWQNLSPWDEASVTWNNSPAIGKAVAALEINDSLEGVWREWVLTSIVEDWVSGSADNYGLRMGRTDRLGSFIYLASNDYSDSIEFRPKLTIEYNNTPVPEPSTMLLLGAGLAGLVGARLRKKKQQNAISPE